jgi:hypothetical protein
MSLLKLYDTNTEEFGRLLTAAVELKIVPENSSVHKLEASFCDAFNERFGNRDFVAAMDAMDNRCTLLQKLVVADDIYAAISLQQAQMVEKGFCSNHAFSRLNFKGEKSPGQLFNMPDEDDFEFEFSKTLFGKPPEFIKRSVNQIGKACYGKKTVEKFGMTMCMGSVTHDLESALSIEQRAIRFLLIKLSALMKNHPLEWILEQMEKAYQDRTDKDSESISYYSDKSFQRIDDPEWKLRYKWLQKSYQLSMTPEDRVRYWLERADKDEFIFDTTNFEEERWWCTTGFVLGEEKTPENLPESRTDEQKETENTSTKSKMDELKQKMIEARLKRFAK